MSTINISLPDSLRDFVQQQVSEGRFADTSAYLQTLIRQDQRKKSKALLERKLIEGLESGDPVPMTEKDWTDIERQVRQRGNARKVK